MNEPHAHDTSANQWTEGDSETFLDFAKIFVPARAEQIATLVQLVPAEAEERFTVVELASGEGLLAQAILERFPHCHYIALDVSMTMRERMVQRLAAYADRLEVRHFELAQSEWRSQLSTPVRCVLSSLSVHHLSGSEKRQLFRDMARRLEPGGALLIADILEPVSPRVAQLYAQQYDEIVKAQSIALMGDLRGYERFRELQWNYFAYDYYTDENYDQPSVLSEQLRWLGEAGFSTVDCYWLRAGHGIYGGYK